MDQTQNSIDYSQEVEEFDTTASDMSPLEMFRKDPVFKRLKKSLMQNPEQLCTAIKRLGDLDSQIMHDISDNQQEFLTMLTED